MANAGHISPYLAGKELVLETGLPLGIVWSPAYEETTFQMAVGEQLTLVTDGVVEARDAAGALMGFERTTALSVESAEVVAEAAQGFGQDDDITVLTLRGPTRTARGFAWRGRGMHGARVRGVRWVGRSFAARRGRVRTGHSGVGTVWTGGCF